MTYEITTLKHYIVNLKRKHRSLELGIERSKGAAEMLYETISDLEKIVEKLEIQEAEDDK